MDVSKIVANSLKYPFRNIKKLPILFILFILIAIVPIGMLYDNNYVVFFGVVAFFAFILIVPGYLLSIIKNGSIGSSVMPSVSMRDNIHDSIRVLILRMAYMIVPALAFFISFYILGPSSVDMLYNLKIQEFFATLGLMIVLVVVTYLLFEFLLFFAKARLAYLNSLSEALKIHKVIRDIRNIGIFTIIKWLIIMLVLIGVVSVVTSAVISIPYVGYLIYIAIVIPIIESISNYSVGLLYSNISRNSDDMRLNQFERNLGSF